MKRGEPKQRGLYRGGPRKPGRGKKLGRPPGPRPWVPRVERAAVSRHEPLHIVLRVRSDIDLRDFPAHEAIRSSMNVGRMRFGFRNVHYSVQKDHIHILGEAKDKRALARGMQGLEIRIAKALNRVRYERGKVFVDRYFARPLRSPKEVRNALSYVLNNYRRHAYKKRQILKARWLDPYSSSSYFDGWRDGVDADPIDADAPVVGPSTWLLRVGWKRHGPIPIDEIPASGRPDRAGPDARP